MFVWSRDSAKPLARSTRRDKESAEIKYRFYIRKNFYKKPDSRTYIHPAEIAEIPHATPANNFKFLVLIADHLQVVCSQKLFSEITQLKIYGK